LFTEFAMQLLNCLDPILTVSAAAEPEVL